MASKTLSLGCASLERTVSRTRADEEQRLNVTTVGTSKNEYFHLTPLSHPYKAQSHV